ncbi:hypothetical protein ANN_00930 [Periplaneta americana]|uniref:Uncharacterized protein n=1 Tax=Periplaneta americana TaxID=6978 RepID=A0ABQ8TS53_PERAM|nr:hypothetical protein ANN_00930 [Periplaneta americana]
MAGLCEGGNEPPDFLKSICKLPLPGFEPGPPGFAARRADRYSKGVDPGFGSGPVGSGSDLDFKIRLVFGKAEP